MKALFTKILFSSALFLSFAVPVTAAGYSAPSPLDVIQAVNALRASHGLPPYEVDPILMAAAQMQADYLASIAPNVGNGHVGPGGTDADARALSLGYPAVPGLDINENWGTVFEGQTIESLIYGGWSDALHTHTMLHERGQHVGAGVAVSGNAAYIILDVAAFWGDAGLTDQPTTGSYLSPEEGGWAVSQYIAPLLTVEPKADGSVTHVVQSGQSLWMIAHHYDTDVATLQKLNNLGSWETIYVGQEIIVNPPLPATETPEPVKPAEVIHPTDMGGPAMVQPTAAEEILSEDVLFDDTGWYLFFFSLLGIGIILVVLSISNRAK